MSSKRIIMVLICVLSGFIHSAYTTNAPEMHRNKAVPVSGKSLEIVGPMGVKDLIQDDYFLKNLSEILKRDDFTEDDKVDVFYLMLKKIKWSFSGVLDIPPKYDYRMLFNNYAGIFVSYQKFLKSLNYNGKGLLEIAKRDYKSNVMHASNALLLAAILDPQSFIQDISFFLDFRHIQESQFADIFLHYICLATTLTLKLEYVLQLSDFLNQEISEEAKEDLLCSLSIYALPESMKRVFVFLAKPHESGEDLAVETGMIVLNKRTPPQYFQQMKEQLMEVNPDLKKSFAELEKNNFTSCITQKQGTFLKTWDDVDITLYDDGMFISYKNKFTDFIEKQVV